MSIITTSGATNANSYGAIGQADQHHEDRNNIDWAIATEEEKTAALIRSTDYLDLAYSFPGVRGSINQSLECPRYGEAALEPRLVKACLELALHMLSDNSNTKADQAVLSESSSLEGLGSTSKTYAAASFDPYPNVTKMLGGYATLKSSAGGSIRMINP